MKIKKLRYRLKVKMGKEVITEHKNIKSIQRELSACYSLLKNFSFTIWDRKRFRETKGRYY